MPFDPTRGSDHARAYATKYCSKPEKWWNAPPLAADHHPSRRHSPCPPSPQTPSVLQTHPSPRPQTPTPHPPTPAESSPLPQTPSPSRRPPASDHRSRRGKGRMGVVCAKWYFLETVADGLKNWLKARTVGICMAFNRLLSFHVVRSTRPCTYVPACFIGKKEYRNLRDPGHIEKYPQFPDPQHHAPHTGRSKFTVLPWVFRTNS